MNGISALQFARCHFNYYCSEFLKLRDSKKIQFTHNDIGSLIHKIFQHFLILEGSEGKEYTSEELMEIITRLTDEYTDALCGIHGISNKMKHYFSRLKSTICVFVEALLKEKRASNFTPEFFELKIHGDNSPLQLELPVDDNHTAVIRGYVDRVDVCRVASQRDDGTVDEENSTTYVKILDYKTGSHIFKRARLEKGLDMQMLIYLLALTQMKDSYFKEKLLGGMKNLKPAGVTYLTYKVNKTDVGCEVDFSSSEVIAEEKNAIEEKISRSGIALADPYLMPTDKQFNLSKPSYVSKDEFDVIFDQVKASISSLALKMLSGAAYAEPLKGENPCRYCKNKAICRRKETL